MNMAVLLKVENLIRNYYKLSKDDTQQEIKVLKNLNFSINENEFVGIMGKSGCGKTTLLKVLGLIDRPTSGTLYFKENEVRKLWDEKITDIRRKQMGFVFQDFYLMDSLTVEENIMLPLILDKKSVRRCFTTARKFEELFEIEHLAHKNPYELSGGEKQRVAICRALVNNPDLILADEPTGNLDSNSGKIVINALEDIHQRLHKTIVIVTHDPEIASHCNRILFLKDGMILDDIRKSGSNEEFYLKIQNIRRCLL